MGGFGHNVVSERYMLLPAHQPVSVENMIGAIGHSLHKATARDDFEDEDPDGTA